MKNPNIVTPTIKGRVYTVPTYTNLYGAIVDGNPLSLKFYTKDSNIENHGVKPVSLLAAIIDHLKDNNPGVVEATAITKLDSAMSLLNFKQK